MESGNVRMECNAVTGCGDVLQWSQGAWGSNAVEWGGRGDGMQWHEVTCDGTSCSKGTWDWNAM